MRLAVIDPAAYTPPYDRALCGALAAAGHDVTLVTSPFGYGDVPPARGFAVDERFYARGGGLGGRVRQVARLAQHVPGMLSLRRADADVAHFQWLALQAVDRWLLPPRVPTVLTAHDVLPREPRPGAVKAQRALYEQVDAVIVHTASGRERLLELGIDPAKVSVIPHGVLDWLTAVRPQRPPELAEPSRPVVLLFGLLRPYKGLDLLAEQWPAGLDADLWVVGMPRMAIPPLPPGTRLVPRFVSDAEAAWVFSRATCVVLPYREIEQSGVLFTALAFGTPVVLSDVGGFAEVDAARRAPLDGIGAAVADVLDDAAPWAARSREAAATTYAWGPIAAAHTRVYERIAGT